MENFGPKKGSKADSVTKPARILIVAGSDSGGGAGIQADIKTVTMLGGHAMTAVTAVTAQNTLGVNAVHPVPAEMILAQIDAIISDIGVDAVKIGMIGSGFAAKQVAVRLQELRSNQPDLPIVFDPVMVSTSGSLLADDSTIAAFGRLMDVATLATPNLPELKRTKDPQMGDITPYLLLDAKGNLEDAPRLGAYRRTGRLTATLAFFSFGRWMDQAYTRWKRSRPSKKPASPALAGKGGGSLYEQAWAITEKVLERFQKEVASDGAWFGIAVIPSDMGALAKTGRLTSEAAARIDRLQSTAARLSIPLLDLSQTFVSLVRQQGPQRLSFDCDDHWNARGHAEAAPALLQLLRTAGVL